MCGVCGTYHYGTARVASAPQRVLILVENLPVPFDRRVWMEARTLTSAGYGVSIICPQGDYATQFEEIEGITIYRYRLPSLSGVAGHLLEYAWAVAATFLLTCRVLHRQGFSVIQSANPPDLFFLIGRVFKLCGKKFVFDHHDLAPEICDSRWTGSTRAVLRRVCLWMERATFRTADRVIATNESYREVALTRGGVARERVAVVRSAPSLTEFCSVRPRAAMKQGRPFLVAYLGVMGPNDGLSCLLESIRHIVHVLGRRDIQFTLIGDGDLRPALMAETRRLRLEGAVTFTGRLPDTDVIALLSTAEVCVVPDPKDALNDLSSMNKVVEYMALGRPLVAFDLKETRASAADAALYARPNDPIDFAQKIIELLAAPERRERMGSHARLRFVSTLAWEHQASVLISLYRDLIGNP
jgi:glycosyltransferase involved in cell wall biosynthesis